MNRLSSAWVDTTELTLLLPVAQLPFSDFGLRWFEAIVERITEWFVLELTEGLRNTTVALLDTPLPEGQGIEVVFSKPPATDAIWRSIYESTVAGETMVFALLVLFVCVQGHHFVRIFSYGSVYEARKARRSSWVGAFLIVTWYWVAVLFLYFIEAVTIGLVPDVQRLGSTLVELLPQAAGTPGLTLFMAGLGGLAMVSLKALFFIREVLLYIYLYSMPLGIAVAYGNVPLLSPLTRRLIAQFVPLAALPLPAAILFRGYELLFVGEQQLELGSEFTQYLVVISLPLITLYVTWKTFKYASPLTARVLGGASRGVLLAGTAATAGYLAGPTAAAVGARWGPKAALGSTLASTRYGTNGSQTADESRDGSGDAEGDDDQFGIPEYRRSENDPGNNR